MHVNSVEGRGWLGDKVDRCDGLSERCSTEATSQVEQSVSVLGLEARVYFQLSSAYVASPIQSVPVQSSSVDRRVNKWKSSGDMRFLLCSDAV